PFSPQLVLGSRGLRFFAGPVELYLRRLEEADREAAAVRCATAPTAHDARRWRRAARLAGRRPHVTKPADYHRLAREIEAGDAGQFQRLAVLSTFTAELLRPFLIVECQRLGCPVRPWFGPFQQLEQMVLDAASRLWQEAPDVLWIALRLEDVDRYL